MLQRVRVNRYIPFLGQGFERTDVIEMPMRQHDRPWAASATKSRLTRRPEIGGRARHSCVDECPVSVSGSGPPPEDDVDDGNLTVCEVRRDFARLVIAQLVGLRSVGTGGLGQGNLCHGFFLTG